MKKLFLFSVMVFFALSSQVNADDLNKSWYIGGEVAYVDQTLDDMHVSQGGVDWTSAYDLMDQLDSHSFGLFTGYKFENRLRLEAKYNYILSEDKEGLDNIIKTNHIKLGVKIHKIIASIFYDYELPKDFTIYAGVGAGGAYVIPNSSVYDATGTWGFSNKADPSLVFAWEVAAGVAYAITDAIDLTFQYTYSDLGNVAWENTGANGPGVTDLFAGDADVTLDAFSLGVRYNF